MARRPYLASCRILQKWANGHDTRMSKATAAPGCTCLLRGAGQQAVVGVGVQAGDVKLAPAKPHRHGVLRGRRVP